MSTSERLSDAIQRSKYVENILEGTAKKKEAHPPDMSQRVRQVKTITGWEEDDIVAVLEDVNYDADYAADRIIEGFYEKQLWKTVGEKKTKRPQKEGKPNAQSSKKSKGRNGAAEASRRKMEEEDPFREEAPKRRAKKGPKAPKENGAPKPAKAASQAPPAPPASSSATPAAHPEPQPTAQPAQPSPQAASGTAATTAHAPPRNDWLSHSAKVREPPASQLPKAVPSRTPAAPAATAAVATAHPAVSAAGGVSAGPAAAGAGKPAPSAAPAQAQPPSMQPQPPSQAQPQPAAVTLPSRQSRRGRQPNGEQKATAAAPTATTARPPSLAPAPAAAPAPSPSPASTSAASSATPATTPTPAAQPTAAQPSTPAAATAQPVAASQPPTAAPASAAPPAQPAPSQRSKKSRGGKQGGPRGAGRQQQWKKSGEHGVRSQPRSAFAPVSLPTVADVDDYEINLDLSGDDDQAVAPAPESPAAQPHAERTSEAVKASGKEQEPRGPAHHGPTHPQPIPPVAAQPHFPAEGYPPHPSMDASSGMSPVDPQTARLGEHIARGYEAEHPGMHYPYGVPFMPMPPAAYAFTSEGDAATTEALARMRMPAYYHADPAYFNQARTSSPELTTKTFRAGATGGATTAGAAGSATAGKFPSAEQQTASTTAASQPSQTSANAPSSPPGSAGGMPHYMPGYPHPMYYYAQYYGQPPATQYPHQYAGAGRGMPYGYGGAKVAGTPAAYQGSVNFPAPSSAGYHANPPAGANTGLATGYEEVAQYQQGSYYMDPSVPGMDISNHRFQ